MPASRIFVEVSQSEAKLLVAALVRCDREIVSLEQQAIKMMGGEAVSEERLRDRFDIAATTNDEPVPFLGRAIFIGREMT